MKLRRLLWNTPGRLFTILLVLILGVQMGMQAKIGGSAKIGGTTKAAVFQGSSTSYALRFDTTSTTSLSDATTYYFGYPHTGYSWLAASSPNYDAFKIVFPSACTIKAVGWRLFNDSTVASNENVSMYLRINDTTDVTITTTADYSGATGGGLTTGLNTSVSAGDFFVIKVVTPTWATNPNGVRINGDVFCQ